MWVAAYVGVGATARTTGCGRMWGGEGGNDASCALNL
jgi:hypothetical protein